TELRDRLSALDRFKFQMLDFYLQSWLSIKLSLLVVLRGLRFNTSRYQGLIRDSPKPLLPLQGRQPNDLPIEQPTKFKLAINLKTAKAMGLTIPEGFLLRADSLLE